MDLCSQTICVNNKLKSFMKNDYKIGEEIIPKISRLNFWNVNAYILNTLEGTECGENAVSFDF